MLGGSVLVAVTETTRLLLALLKKTQIDIEDLLDVLVFLLLIRLFLKLAEKLLSMRSNLCR